MITAKRRGLTGAVIMLGVVLVMAAVVMTSNAPAHANSSPDLEVGTPSVDDATIYTGNRFTLSVTVTNSGDVASEATRLRGYRSTDSTITTSDTEEGSQTVNALAAAGSSSFDHGLTAPSEAGTYYYGVCVDSVTHESDTTNNCSSSVAVTVSDPVPDLVVIGIDATNNIVTGGSFRVWVTVTNQGDAQSAATTLRWKKEVDGTTTEVGTDDVRALTRPQGNFETIRLTAPLTPTTSYYWACVDSVADESDTTNNCSGRVTVTVTNNLATGAPTISGTAQVGETLTANISGIADDDGLDNVSFTYQWIANDGSDDADIEGKTAQTYEVSDDDAGKTIKVRATFTDDRENEESLTSEPTAPVVAATAPEPLTASHRDAPASHDGQDSFTFELSFSEEVELSYLTLRDHALTVAGGEVTGASRLDKPSNIRWQVTVEPDSDGGVTIVLPATTDCSNQGAVCTGGGKKLSAGVELTVPGPAAQQPQNSEATGAPTISGTVQVGQTLTASTSGIADADGLDNVSYSYQWMRGDGNTHTDIAGGTGRTYKLSGDDVGRTIKVRVTFTDDAENEESLTSAATGAVAPRPPLTASIQGQPSSHDGQADFTFELRFSEELPVSYLTLRDHAFTVTGGTVIKAQRLTQGSNIGWRITVTPDSDADVTVVLPVTTDCDASGAVCTVDGRKLSNRNEFTVSGP